MGEKSIYNPSTNTVSKMYKVLMRTTEWKDDANLFLTDDVCSFLQKPQGR